MERDEGQASGTLATLAADTVAGPRRGPAPTIGRGDAIGRYLVLGTLGEGGMGVVFAAHDPELDRRVAIKFLRDAGPSGGDGSQARLRLQREAQAMARLTHVNVVAVHDVGFADGRVFVAMELIDGVTLRAWLAAEPRPWRAVLAVLLQAGEGLAAAHRVGLVHRDFKPDNVLVARDGRVCVADFGLAAAGERQAPAERSPEHLATVGAGTLTLPGTIMGTPAYMAPEQFGGGDVTAAADIFAFCVTAYEALYGRRPFAGESLTELCLAASTGEVLPVPRGRHVPARIESLLRRGLHPEPEQRPASMRELLDALARVPGATRRRIAIGGGLLVGVALAGFLIHEPAACTGAADDLAGVWNDGAEDRVRAGFAATNLPYAADTADRVIAGLDHHAADWIAMRTDACAATRVRGEQSEHLLDLRWICLDRQRTGVAALIDLLAAADASVVEHGVALVQGLPAVEHCADADALLRDEAPAEVMDPGERESLESRLAESSLLRDAGRTSEARAVITPAAERARAVAGPRLKARVLREHAKILCMDDHPDAGHLAREALAAALAAGDELSFADAAACMLETEEEAGRDIEVWKDLAESALTRSADDLILARLLAGYGTALRMRSRMQEAFVALRRVLELRRRHADERPDLVAGALYTLGTTHLMAEQMDEGLALIAEAMAVWRDTLGPDHPNLLQALRTLSVVHYRRGELVEAIDMARRHLAGLIKLHGPDHPRVGDAHNMLSSVLIPYGAFAEARPHLEAALAIARTNTNQRRKLAYALANLANLEILEGNLDVAGPLLDEATRELVLLCVPPHPDLVPLIGMYGVLALRRGDLPAAEAYLRGAREMSLRVRGEGGILDPDAHIALADALERRGDPRGALVELGRLAAADATIVLDHDRAAAAFVRGRALTALGDPAAGRAEVRRAAALYATVRPGYSLERAAIDAWLASSRP